eukprot:23688-Rhodomonas_salina.2
MILIFRFPVTFYDRFRLPLKIDRTRSVSVTLSLSITLIASAALQTPKSSRKDGWPTDSGRGTRGGEALGARSQHASL